MPVRVPLEESALFKGLSPAVLARIRGLAKEERFENGATIFAEGDPADDLYILGEGEVELSYVIPSNSPVTIRITRIEPGETFGWSALTGAERLTAHARALSETSAYLIHARKLIEILDSEPQSGYLVMTRLAQLIAKRLRDTRNELRWIQSAI